MASSRETSNQHFSDSGARTGPGKVEAHRARLWLRTRESGELTLRLKAPGYEQLLSWEAIHHRESDGALSVVVPDDFDGAAPLPAETQIDYFISDGSGPLGSGRFVTAPVTAAPKDEGERCFSIAILSCHQPFESAAKLQFDSARALDRLPGVLERGGVCRVLALGDQMYTDSPADESLYDPDHFRRVARGGKNSLLDSSPEEVREIFQDRYRKSFGLAGFSQTIANFATTMVPDDHEFIDNFGSAPEHHGEAFASLREGALRACFDYQGLRHLPPGDRPASLHIDWEYGPVATFVMDLRTQRRCDDEELRFFDDSQLAELERHLRAHADKPVFVLGLSIPLAFSPKSLIQVALTFQGEGGDASERWWVEKAERSRKRLIQVLVQHRNEHPEQIFVLVSGDVHAGLATRVELEGAPPVYQLISSPVSNREGLLTRLAAEHIPLFCEMKNDDVSWKPLENSIEGGDNPYAGLNVGLIQVAQHPDGKVEVVLRIVGLGEEEGPREVFRSAPITFCARAPIGPGGRRPSSYL